MMIYFCVKFKMDPLYGFRLTFIAPWWPWQRLPSWIFVNPQSCHTLRGYSHKVSWSLMKGINKNWNLQQSLSNRFNLFGLSRFTRCGCCSYQISSISVRRVTCYDHYCVFFNFFSILAVSMATAAILKKSTLKSSTSHGICYSYKVS